MYELDGKFCRRQITVPFCLSTSTLTATISHVSLHRLYRPAHVGVFSYKTASAGSPYPCKKHASRINRTPGRCSANDSRTLAAGPRTRPSSSFATSPNPPSTLGSTRTLPATPSSRSTTAAHRPSGSLTTSGASLDIRSVVPSGLHPSALSNECIDEQHTSPVAASYSATLSFRSRIAINSASR